MSITDNGFSLSLHNDNGPAVHDGTSGTCLLCVCCVCADNHVLSSDIQRQIQQYGIGANGQQMIVKYVPDMIVGNCTKSAKREAQTCLAVANILNQRLLILHVTSKANKSFSAVTMLHISKVLHSVQNCSHEYCERAHMPQK